MAVASVVTGTLGLLEHDGIVSNAITSGLGLLLLGWVVVGLIVSLWLGRAAR